MVGFPLAGPAFALDALTVDAVARVFAFAVAMFLFFLSLYEFNDYCGHQADATNPRLREPATDPQDLHLKRTVTALVAALLGFALLKPALALGAAVSFGMWSIYSWPTRGWKQVPVLGTGIHFVTQALHFLMGWVLVAALNLDTLLIAFFFGGLFAAGHLFHEVIDFEADRQAGIRTMANRIGRKPAFWISTGAFAACSVYWALLFMAGRIAENAYAPFAGAFLLHAAVLTVFYLSGRVNERAGVLQLRAAYRAAYLLAGLAFVVHKFAFSAAG